MSVSNATLALYPNPPVNLLPEVISALTADGAGLLGGLLVFSRKQLGALTEDVSVIDLVDGVLVKAGSLLHVPPIMRESGLSTACLPYQFRKSPQNAGTLSRTLVVGLSGSIGSGKSLALSYFEEAGAKVFSADDFARLVVEPGTPGLAAVVTEFGECVVDGNGLKRKVLAELVFSDASKRTRLEAILHPLIRKAFLAELFGAMEAIRPHSQIVVYEIPLLFESKHSFPELSERILISVDPTIARARVAAQRAMSVEEVDSRMNAQMSLSDKRKLATIEIANDGSAEELRRNVGLIYQRLLSEQIEC